MSRSAVQQWQRLEWVPFSAGFLLHKDKDCFPKTVDATERTQIGRRGVLSCITPGFSFRVTKLYGNLTGVISPPFFVLFLFFKAGFFCVTLVVLEFTQ